MSLSQSNHLHHLLHLIRWCTTLFNLLCWTWKHFHKQTTESQRFKSPQISFTEAGVVLQHLPWAKRYFLTEECHQLADRKHIPSAHSDSIHEEANQQKIPKGHIKRNLPLVFLKMQVYWTCSFFETMLTHLQITGKLYGPECIMKKAFHIWPSDS